mmetsp:Transcript_13371/g.19903  ORF Transcript_13371/g.19903 Transcript_13371/m.19903 type:complete len:645 (-) Transcript_13371:28-1962(-)|eukprot:CAMPEP_0116028694 /NCGR_PEP_ID=MMETSP0321-20121206/15604_1 /TAXON_ID=163516 /ORGANISM="Leptocylindrus danicus var. danicus, Strain B650" /LENGTH=644 /DNA_ID=CAMNT_0003502743 /DNA_START=56 /DNA_END=1990 /DNA_ORIENTATION=-
MTDAENFAAYKAKYESSITNPKAHWDELAKAVDWIQPYTHTASGKFEDGNVKFYTNGKLNVCYNCVDRHVEAGKGDDIAVVHEGDEIGSGEKVTFNDLLGRVGRLVNLFKARGVQKGDVVTIYMPMTCDIVVAMLACARMGAVHSVVFAGFSAESIRERILHSKSKFVCTAFEGHRGGRRLPLYDIVCNAIAPDEVSKDLLQNLFVFGDAPTIAELPTKHVAVKPLLESYRPYAPCEMMDAEDPLFILFTSGSTGKPKGLVHTTAGYAVWAHYTCTNVFNLGLGSGVKYACVADAGWITGHTYIVYGPLLCGNQTMVFESTPVYPDEGRYWDLVQRHKLEVFYTAPTAIRSLMRYGDGPPQKYDLSSLKHLGTVGEPINPAAWQWYHDIIGNKRCSVLDTYWQTETGGHIVSNLPNCTPMKPGSCTLPLPGIDTVVLDAHSGSIIEDVECSGLLAIRQPWPGMTRSCLGDHARYMTTYFNSYKGYYVTGDGCKRDADGYIWITGRVDDVLNVSGHRIGTAEVESALVAHSAVAQAAVIGFPHEIKGQGICCYCTLVANDSTDEAKLTLELRSAIRSAIGPFATPDMIVLSSKLPMTRSGKIMRRILRKISSGELDSLGDTSTLADPDVVPFLIEKVKDLQSKKK